MNPFLDNRDEQRHRLASQTKKMEEMRRQKRLQLQHRRKTKQLIVRGCTVLVVAAVISLIVVLSLVGEGISRIRAEDEKLEIAIQQIRDEEQQENGPGESNFQSGQPEKTYGPGSSLPEDTHEQKDGKTAGDYGQEDGKTAGVYGQGSAGVEEDKSLEVWSDSIQPTTYRFATTPETVAVYDEEIMSSNVILVDESKDTIVAAKAERERISPASMTKIMTILVAAERLTKEQLEDTFIMTREITDYGYMNDCSTVGFLDGEEIRVRDMFYGTILQSGSDAAVGLATYIAGSHEAFVDMMNEKLKQLGLEKTSHFTNCVGLYDENHYSTVYDMAVIMKAAIQNEFCKEVLSCHTYTTKSTTEHPEGITISNWFLRRIEDKDTGGLVVGAKTGYVMQSKNCAVSYGTFANGSPYICVTTGSTSSWRCIYDHVEIYNQYVSA